MKTILTPHRLHITPSDVDKTGWDYRWASVSDNPPFKGGGWKVEPMYGDNEVYVYIVYPTLREAIAAGRRWVRTAEWSNK